MELTTTDIEDINYACPNREQGIYTQPNGIPVDVKGLVIYHRYEIGGMGGGGYGGYSAKPYKVEEPDSKFKVLDITLSKLKSNISYLQYREIEDLIQTNEDEYREYYGNSTDYKIQYIVL